MEGSSSRPARRPTHIHDLTDDCLANILSRVGDAPLPIKRPQHGDIRVHHPLQSTLVCKRWRNRAPSAVRSLYLTQRSLEKSLAQQAQRFPKLRRLRLARWDGQSDFSDDLLTIARATPRLKQLEINWTCRCSYEIGIALCSWTRLKELDIRGGSFGNGSAREMHSQLLHTLPKMSSLKALNVHGGIGAKDIWEKICPQLPHLQSLTLHWCSRGPPPPSLAQFPSLNLYVRSPHWVQVTVLPRPLLTFRNIKELVLSNIRVKLPESLGSLRSVESLRLEKCNLSSLIPSSIGQLTALKVLKIRQFKKLWELPRSICNLVELRVLHVDDVAALETLPLGIGRLTKLEDLRLSGRKKGEWYMTEQEMTPLSELPHSLGGLRRVQRLTLQHLPEMRRLPESLGGMCWLREIHLLSMTTLWKLPDSIGQLGCLESMSLVDCGIGSLPETLGQLSTLKRLRVESCNRIRHLPESMSNLANLEELWVDTCEGMMDLPPGLGALVGLRELVVRRCWQFTDKTDVIPRLEGLRYLEFSGCKRQRCLPDGLEKLPGLRRIKCSPGMIERASKVSHYPKGFLGIMEADPEAARFESLADDNVHPSLLRMWTTVDEKEPSDDEQLSSYAWIDDPWSGDEDGYCDSEEYED